MGGPRGLPAEAIVRASRTPRLGDARWIPMEQPLSCKHRKQECPRHRAQTSCGVRAGQGGAMGMSKPRRAWAVPGVPSRDGRAGSSSSPRRHGCSLCSRTPGTSCASATKSQLPALKGNAPDGIGLACDPQPATARRQPGKQPRVSRPGGGGHGPGVKPPLGPRLRGACSALP